jgi:Ni/Co efflux regulator RcnB
VKRLVILLATACLALPAMAGAQGYEHRGHEGGGRGESHDRGGGDRGGHDRDGGDRGAHNRDGGRRDGGYRDPFGGDRLAPGPVYGGRDGYPGPGHRGAPAHSYRFIRGQFLPQEYRGYVVNDYDRYHLRRPPRGYYWYRAGDDYVLAALASGLIFEVINAEGY